jgi:GDP-D-mannose dehydratase
MNHNYVDLMNTIEKHLNHVNDLVFFYDLMTKKSKNRDYVLLTKKLHDVLTYISKDCLYKKKKVFSKIDFSKISLSNNHKTSHTIENYVNQNI